MDNLTPVTRTERLLDGEDLTPTNREEMFIKRIYDKTQEIPEPVNRKEYFLKKAGEAGGDITTESLSVTENGTYTAPSGKAYSPVTVEVQPPENSYQLKSMTTPTSLATFEASAMPMPTLKASIKAQQASGTPSPSNPLPISGWSGANIVNMSDATNKQYFEGLLNGTYGYVDLGDVNWNYRNDSNVYSPYFWCYTELFNNGNIKYNGPWSSVLQNAIIVNAPYTNTTRNTSVFVDGCFTFEGGSAVTTQLQVKDYSYTDANSFKTSMSGVYLIYELATPIAPLTPSQFKDLLTAFGLDGYYVTVQFGQTVYGGELDVVNGELKITDGYIASYNGESLPSTWISSMDVYAEGTTPTTGAEVCYELATPITIPLTPSLIKSLEGTNNLSVDCGEVMECEWLEAL